MRIKVRAFRAKTRASARMIVRATTAVDCPHHKVSCHATEIEIFGFFNIEASGCDGLYG
jgi:hypothetical protein